MIENRTDVYRSKVELRFVVDNLEDLDKPLSEYIHPSEIVRIMDTPDADGKFRFLVEIVRIHAT